MNTEITYSDFAKLAAQRHWTVESWLHAFVERSRCRVSSLAGCWGTAAQRRPSRIDR